MPAQNLIRVKDVLSTFWNWGHNTSLNAACSRRPPLLTLPDHILPSASVSSLRLLISLCLLQFPLLRLFVTLMTFFWSAFTDLLERFSKKIYKTQTRARTHARAVSTWHESLKLTRNSSIYRLGGRWSRQNITCFTRSHTSNKTSCVFKKINLHSGCNFLQFVFLISIIYLLHYLQMCCIKRKRSMVVVISLPCLYTADVSKQTNNDNNNKKRRDSLSY